jgi:hypothetical protein
MEYHVPGSGWVVTVFDNDAPSMSKIFAEARAMDREQARQRARLIASAPDLLAALKGFVESYDLLTANMPKGIALDSVMGYFGTGQVISEARAAIAAATGEGR